MENLLDKEYLHNGTDIIYKELWNKIYMNPANGNYTKPIGGFWTVPFYECYSEWLDYLYTHDKSMYYNALIKNNLIVKLKNNTKILIIDNENDFKNLKDSNLTIKLNQPIPILKFYDYVNIDEIPDYEKLADLYDAVYVNHNSDDALFLFSVKTMLIINPNSILYYKPVSLTNDEEGEMEILSIGKEETIKPLNRDYYELVSLIKKDFEPLINSITSLDDLKRIKELIHNKYFNNNYLEYLKGENISISDVVKVIINNIEVDNKDIIRKQLKK